MLQPSSGHRKPFTVFVDDNGKNDNDARNHLAHKIAQAIEDQAIG
jgi:hypothetical protein